MEVYPPLFMGKNGCIAVNSGFSVLRHTEVRTVSYCAARAFGPRVVVKGGIIVGSSYRLNTVGAVYVSSGIIVTDQICVSSRFRKGLSTSSLLVSMTRHSLCSGNKVRVRGGI